MGLGSICIEAIVVAWTGLVALPLVAVKQASTVDDTRGEAIAQGDTSLLEMLKSTNYTTKAALKLSV